MTLDVVPEEVRKFGPRGAILLAHFREKSKGFPVAIDARALRDQFGFSPRTVSNEIRNLVAKGVLVREEQAHVVSTEKVPEGCAVQICLQPSELCVMSESGRPLSRVEWLELTGGQHCVTVKLPTRWKA